MNAPSNDSQLDPIIIDLGKKRRKAIKDLKRGQGKLMDEVYDAVDQIRARLGADAAKKEILPVVLIYKQKSKRGGGILGL